MTTGFGFCANCGTPKSAADQKFCAGCGSMLASVPPPEPVQAAAVPPAPVQAAAVPPPPAQIPVAPPVAQPDAEPAWSTPQAAAPTPTPPPWAAHASAVPTPPPAWSTPPTAPPAAPPPPTAPPAAPAPWAGQPAQPAQQYPPQQYPYGYPGGAAPTAQPAPAASAAAFKITPPMLLVGGLVIAALVGAYFFMNMGSSSSSITFTPSTLSCSNPVTFTTTAHLPASVHAGDTITITFDGKPAGSSQVSASGSDVTQQPDGSWLVVSTTTPDSMQQLCAVGGAAGGYNVLTPGTHTMQVLDANGKVLAQGSYTVKP